MSFFDDLGGGITNLLDATSGKNQIEANQIQNAQQDKVLELEKQRLALLASTASSSSGLSTGAIVGIVLGSLALLGGLIYFATRPKQV